MKNNAKIDVWQLDRDELASFENSPKGLQKPVATLYTDRPQDADSFQAKMGKSPAKYRKIQPNFNRFP